MGAEQADELLWQWVPVRIYSFCITSIILLVWIFLVLSEALISEIEFSTLVEDIALHIPVGELF